MLVLRKSAFERALGVKCRGGRGPGAGIFWAFAIERGIEIQKRARIACRRVGFVKRALRASDKLYSRIGAIADPFSRRRRGAGGERAA